MRRLSQPKGNKINNIIVVLNSKSKNLDQKVMTANKLT